MKTELTLFQGRVGDHNDFAIPGARALAAEFGTVMGLSPTVIGHPAPALNTSWDVELEKARTGLTDLKDRFEKIYSVGDRAISATSRCAASIATLPSVVRYHPDACVVWFDAHADLNTPESTESGYLGGLALSAPMGLWASGFGAGLNPKNVILVGQRDLDPFEAQLIRDMSICHLPPSEMVAEQLQAAIGGRSVYVHIDCDVLNPGIVPTDYVHENGLSLDQLHEACVAIARNEIIGAEVAEFQCYADYGSPPVSPAHLVRALMPLLHGVVRGSDGPLRSDTCR